MVGQNSYTELNNVLCDVADRHTLIMRVSITLILTGTHVKLVLWIWKEGNLLILLRTASTRNMFYILPVGRLYSI